jgi:hypothetical protein
MGSAATGYALAIIGLVQTVLTLIIGSTNIFAPTYEGILAEQVKADEFLGLKEFFEEKRVVQGATLGAKRLITVASASGTAGLVTSLCTALIVSAGGAAALAIVFTQTRQPIAWALSCGAFALIGVVLLGVLICLLRRNKLRTFGLDLRGGAGGIAGRLLDFKTPNPYLGYQVLAAAFVTAVGLVVL